MIRLFRFLNIFRRKDPPYDESSDCFDAMKGALRRYEEQYGGMELYIFKMKKEEQEKEKEKRELERTNEQNERNHSRYTLQYLYNGTNKR